MIGATIRKIRIEKSITQRELAKSLDVTRQAVSQWESSTRLPDIVMLIKLADYFDVSLDYLTGRENEDGTKAYKIKQHF